ncbi:MAG: hypothetical protein JXA09_14885 [Anaerolineae bacterium]|nr:hypothetical protein [Anaerolineae bacterium]
MRLKRTRLAAALIAACLIQGMILGCWCGSLPVQVSLSTATPDPTVTLGTQPTAIPTLVPTPATGSAAGRVYPRPYAYTEAEAAALSEDQRGVLHDLGWPHAFSMIRLPDDVGDEHWVETWHYYDVGVVFVFRDRAFHHQEPERSVPAYQIAATSYRPNQFYTRDLLPELDWREVEGLNALLPAEALFYAQDGVMIGFQGEELAFVEAIAMLPREE